MVDLLTFKTFYLAGIVSYTGEMALGIETFYLCI